MEAKYVVRSIEEFIELMEKIGSIDSVKNPRSGKIVADAVGEIITEAPVVECSGEVIIR